MTLPNVMSASRNLYCAWTYARECSKVNQDSPGVGAAFDGRASSGSCSMFIPSLASWTGAQLGCGLARRARDRALEEGPRGPAERGAELI
jgi:hypothetical protein